MRTKRLLFYVAPILALGITVLILLLSLQRYAFRDTVPSGVVVAGIPMGGMTFHQAIQILDTKLAELENEPITYSFREKQTTQTLSWKNSGITFNVPDFRTELASLSHASLWSRLQIRSQFSKEWRLQARYDSQPLKLKFSPEWEKAHFGRPVNAVRTIGADDRIRYINGKSVYRIDWAALTAQLQAALPTVLPGGDAAKGDKSSRGTVLSGIKARFMSSSAVRSEVRAGAQAETITLEVPLIRLQPEVTLDHLKAQGINRKIVQFSTDLTTSGKGRLHNVAAAARSIDGMLLAPGEIFDYAKVVEAAEQDYGFQEAPVIFGGKLVPGVGGGICQVSSTLYNAALRAGLEIVERRNHTLPVSYIPKGQDATFAKGYINFRFKNTTGTHLLIHAKSSQGRLVIKLYGTLPGNVTYDIQSRTIRTLPPSNKYIKNPSLPTGEQELMLEGKPGYIVETYRLKKVDGVTVSRTLLSRDTYPSQPTVIAVHDGTEGSSNRPQQIVEDGVEGPRFP